jgi:hypothetical protein
MGPSVLIQDGNRLPEPPGGPAAVVADRSSGAYTTALAVGGGRAVVDWQLHLERLVRFVLLVDCIKYASQLRAPAELASIVPGGESSSSSSLICTS